MIALALYLDCCLGGAGSGLLSLLLLDRINTACNRLARLRGGFSRVG